MVSPILANAEFFSMSSVCPTQPTATITSYASGGWAVEHFHLYVVMYIRIVVLSTVLDNRIVNIINMFFTYPWSESTC